MGKQNKKREEPIEPESTPKNSTPSQRPRPKREKKKSQTAEEQELEIYFSKKRCEICNYDHKEQQLLLCDRCDDPYHLQCLNPPMESLPEEEWICPVCQKQLKLVTLNTESKIVTQPETICYKCKQSLNKIASIKGRDQSNNPIQIECPTLTNLTCLYCKHIYHNFCFSERKNSLNCQTCQKIIRKNGPKSHDEFMKFIEKAEQDVSLSDHSLLTHDKERQSEKRHRHFRLKVPNYMSSWQFIVHYEASLYYAFKTKGLTFVDDQIYRNKDKQYLLSLNSPQRDCHDVIYRLHEKDERIYQEFKINSKKGYVGPFEVKEDRIKGFYLVATDYIEPYTIVSEYSGEVMTFRDALNYEENDSIFTLVRGHRAVQSLDIVPQRYGNISRFFSGINNSLKRSHWSKLQNIRSLRFSYRGRVHLLLHTIKPVQAGETLYFDYNGSAFQQYPTEHFVE